VHGRNDVANRELTLDKFLFSGAGSDAPQARWVTGGQRAPACRRFLLCKRSVGMKRQEVEVGWSGCIERGWQGSRLEGEWLAQAYEQIEPVRNGARRDHVGVGPRSRRRQGWMVQGGASDARRD